MFPLVISVNPITVCILSYKRKEKKRHTSCSCCVREENKKKKYRRNTSCVGWWSVSSFLAHTTWLFYDSSSCLWNSIFKDTHTHTFRYRGKREIRNQYLTATANCRAQLLTRVTANYSTVLLPLLFLDLVNFFKCSFFSLSQSNKRAQVVQGEGDIWLDLLGEMECVWSVTGEKLDGTNHAGRN